MKKFIVQIVLTMLPALSMLAQDRPVMGTVLLNGKEIPAEYRLSGSQATLGSGRNACIPHHSSGRLIVPSTITVDGSTYDVTAISPMAFRLCNNITFVQLPEGVESIGNFAFKGCAGLVELALPSTLQTIGSGAFVGLSGLKCIYCPAAEPPKWEYNDVFCRHEGGIGSSQTYSNSTTNLYVPLDKMDEYRNSVFSDESLGWTTPDGWCFFTNVKGINDYETEWGLGISTPIALNHFRDRVNAGDTFAGKIVKIEADLDMMGQEWDTGIGGRDGFFNGTFEGQAHTISNLRIEVPEDKNIQQLGFFTRVVDATVTNLRIDNLKVISKSSRSDWAGVIAGTSSSSTISNTYVKNSEVHAMGDVGGLIGGDVMSKINKCVVDNIYVNNNNDESHRGTGAGGLVGRAEVTKIRNCAVINRRDPVNLSEYCIAGPFVGLGDYGRTTVDYCYSDAKVFSGNGALFDEESYMPFVPTMEKNGYTHGEHVVMFRQKVWNPEQNRDVEISQGMMKNFMYLVTYLGLKDWVYCVGEYPLPDCFEDLYEVKVNHFSLRPATLTTPRPNALAPTVNISADDWKWGKYRNASFTTSSLWFDDNLNFADREQIPIGTATIECTNGVRYDRTLTAPEKGTQTTEYPVYQTDEDGMIVLDDNGKRIPTGETASVEETVYEPTPYCLYLPYSLTFSNGIHLYQPTEVQKLDNSTAQVTFVEKDVLFAEAWTPYYVIVDAPTVSLSTEERVVLLPWEDNRIEVPEGLFFEGARTKVKEGTKEAWLLQTDAIWHKEDSGILPFRSYFYATGSSYGEITKLTSQIKEPEGVGVITGVTGNGKIMNKEVKGWFSLQGVRLNGEPTTSGVYIKDGRKVVIR